MKLFFIKLSRFVRNTTSIVIFLLAILLIFLYHKWVIVQIHHVQAFYIVWQADTEYKKGHFQKAIEKYTYAIKLYPEHYKANYNLGNIYVAYEDYNKAVEYYEKALIANPDYYNARINMGIVLAQKILDLDRAMVEYKKVINARPFLINIPFIYNNKTAVWHCKAIAYYNLGLAYKDKSLLYTFNSPTSRGYLRQAAKSYRDSISIEHNSYDSHYNLGLTMQLLGVLSDALQEYCKAINLEPMNYEAHYNLAILLRQKLLYTESINELEKAGLLLDARGDVNKTAYIYQILSDVSQRAAIKRLTPGEYISEKLKDTPSKTYNLVYVNGRVTATDDLDKAILENMKTCSACKNDSKSK